jgi:hypothetical protein
MLKPGEQDEVRGWENALMIGSKVHRRSITWKIPETLIFVDYTVRKSEVEDDSMAVSACKIRCNARPMKYL